jgi:hypothetical protein
MTKDDLMNFVPTESQKKAAELMFVALAAEQSIRPVIEKMQAGVMADVKPRKAKEYEGCRDIVGWNDMHLAEDENFQRCLEILNEKYKEKGFEVEYGYCPLLIAEHNLIKARRLLIDEYEPFTKCSFQELICNKGGVENLKKCKK